MYCFKPLVGAPYSTNYLLPKYTQRQRYNLTGPMHEPMVNMHTIIYLNINLYNK